MKTSSLRLVVTLFLIGSCANLRQEQADWPVYGGNKAGNRYSSLKQINLKNVQDLEVAWIYNSADAPVDNGSKHRQEHDELSVARRTSSLRIPLDFNCSFPVCWRRPHFGGASGFERR